MVIDIEAQGMFLPVRLYSFFKGSTEARDTLHCDAKVIPSKEYCAAQIDEAA